MKNSKAIFLLLVMLWSANLLAQTNNNFIIHVVEEKETLYGISRTYEIPVSAIVALNEDVENGLRIGQEIKIPTKTTPENKLMGGVHVVKEKETYYSISKIYNVEVSDLKKWNKKTDNSLVIGEELLIKNTSVEAKLTSTPVPYEGKKIHVVESKETLYSISKQYDVTTEELKKWNKMTSNELSVGQKLIIGDKNEITSKETEKLQIVEEAKVEEKVVEKKEEVKPLKSIEVFQDDKPRRVKNASGFEEIVQTGLAELIEGTSENRKYLALHATAKVGTIMKVRNEMNNQMVMVRVIGTIPATGDNDKILIKLSKAAYNRLGALDKRFRVEVSYMP